MHILKKLAVLSAAAALSFCLAAVPVGAESYPCSGIVTGDVVNIRSGAGTEYSVLTAFTRGTSVEIYEHTGNWYKVAIGNNQYAYICADYVSFHESQELASRSANAGERVVQVAKQYLGTPYSYGGSSPSGFDCSGFTSYVYRQLGYSINRVANDQLSNGIPVSKNELQPGDLLLFKRSGSSQVHHVGIYAGNGMMIHAPQTGDVVKYTSITTGYYNEVYYAARRIVR